MTKLLVVDNATFFGNKEVLTFLHTIGITKVRGYANHSESRGLVESSIRILQTLIRKLLALSPIYDFESILFLAPVLLNRAPNPITGYSPYEMLFGKDLSTLGSLGNNIGTPKYKLFTELVKKEVEEFGKQMEDRISIVSKRIAEEKEKYLSKSNSGKKVKPAYPLGTIVFLKDFSVPKNGRASKFRPRFLKSPNVVVSSSATSVVTMRLADRYVSRHHPDDMLPYRGSEKASLLHQDLPESVLRFLGRPLSSEALVNLA